MTERVAHQRILVVDDMAEIRVMISRVLSRAGYRVDQATTLREAQALDLACYDALIIDARLGDGRGEALIERLAADDPGAAARCVMMTGGSATRLPPGVAVLAKPFDHARLLELADAAARGTAKAAKPAPAGHPASASSHPASASHPVAGPQWHAAELIGRVRAHDYDAMANFVHDGPTQEISAAMLALALIGRSLPTASADQFAERLDEVRALLESAAAALREFTDDRLASLTGQLPLTAALVRQTEHLLAEPLTVRLADDLPAPRRAEAAALGTATEVLLGTVARRRPSARVTVHGDDHVITLALAIAPAPETDADDADDAADAADLAGLDRLARLMGGHAEAGQGQWRWLVHVTLGRS